LALVVRANQNKDQIIILPWLYHPNAWLKLKKQSETPGRKKIVSSAWLYFKNVFRRDPDPVHYLSGFINKYYKMNFNDFINEYRIIFSIDKLLKKEWMYKKLETIAGEAGFNNRNTFISAFKKVTGVKPSEFLKDIKLGKTRDNIARSKISLV
jgi:hypothetical protein